MDETARGPAFVVQPDEGESYWQPVPANGYAEVKVSPRNDPSIDGFSSGVQAIGPGGHVREHWHDAHEELLFCFEGEGRVRLNGVDHPFRPGTMVYVGPWNKHSIHNDGADDLKMTWLLRPGGLEDFFQAIGRPRKAGEAPPEPFPRPDNVGEIEAATVFTRLDASPPGEGEHLAEVGPQDQLSS